MALEEVVKILEQKHIKTDINRFAITCIDPDYPAKSLGKCFEDIDVWYDKDHVQQTGPGWIQVFFAYNKQTKKFDEIKKEDVHKSLEKGVVQIAYKDGTLVAGIPGDVYALALEPHGKGFAFGKPYEASGFVAGNMIKTLINYSEINKEEIRLGQMSHMDCGAYAANVGIHDSFHIEAGKKLDSTGENFVNSEYCNLESHAKRKAAEYAVEQFYTAIGLLKENISVVIPPRVGRTSSMYKRLHESH